MRAPGRAEPLQARRAQEPERVLAALKQAQAARVPEQGRVGLWTGDGVPVVDGLGVDGAAAGELYIDALRAEETKEIFAAGVETHFVERDGCDLCGLSAGEDGELATG